MNEEAVVKIVCAFISKKFPKECNVCGKRYNTLVEYILNTTHTGKPISYDADEGDWQPKEPIGTVSMANCSCGNTLVIESSGMGLITVWRLMSWVRKESKKRGVDLRDVLEDIRNKVDKSVLENENNKIEDQVPG